MRAPAATPGRSCRPSAPTPISASGRGSAKWLSTALYRVRVGAFEEAELYKVPPDASVVFVINHRSNMDYVLVTYLVSESSALSYAVGEWARVWMLQRLIRAMGGYFVRRDSSNPLYRKVLARYVHMATASGVTQAVFPEGGLTRDGRLRPPKLGLLSYMVSGFDPNGARDIVFVPVGINYDRVLEDRVLTAAASTPAGERPRFAFNPLVLTAWIAKGLWQRVRGTWHRYGYACVSFGRPLSLRAYLAERGIDVRALARGAALRRDRAAGAAADAARWGTSCRRCRCRWWRAPSWRAASTGSPAWSSRARCSPSCAG